MTEQLEPRLQRIAQEFQFRRSPAEVEELPKRQTYKQCPTCHEWHWLHEDCPK